MADKEIRARAEGAQITEENGAIRVSGYAAVFGEVASIGGYFDEVIERGAFSSALQRGDDTAFLINHDGLPLARTKSGTLKLSQDDHGLRIDAELDASDPDVQSIVPKMKRGDLDKMSFGFVVKRQEWDESGEIPKRTIKDLELFDVSIVTFPAYAGTEIGLRSLEAYRRENLQTHAKTRMKMRLALSGVK